MISEKLPQNMTLKSWLALVILAISTFTIVTTELAPVGLTPIAEGLHSSESAVGMTVSLYAWVGALSALFASVFLGNVAKKRLLLAVVLMISNILAATVSTYGASTECARIGCTCAWCILGNDWSDCSSHCSCPLYRYGNINRIWRCFCGKRVFGVPVFKLYWHSFGLETGILADGSTQRRGLCGHYCSCPAK